MKIHLDCDAYQGEAYLKARWLNDFEGPTITLDDPVSFRKKAGLIYKAAMPAGTRFELHVPYSRSFLLLGSLHDVTIKEKGGAFLMVAHRLDIEQNKWFNNRTRMAWYCETVSDVAMNISNARYAIHLPQIEYPF